MAMALISSNQQKSAKTQIFILLKNIAMTILFLHTAFVGTQADFLLKKFEHRSILYL